MKSEKNNRCQKFKNIARTSSILPPAVRVWLNKDFECTSMPHPYHKLSNNSIQILFETRHFHLDIDTFPLFSCSKILTNLKMLQWLQKMIGIKVISRGMAETSNKTVAANQLLLNISLATINLRGRSQNLLRIAENRCSVPKHSF